MFERFNRPARQAVVQAQVEALRLNHDRIGPEHLLLALASDREALAAQVLQELGVPVEGLRQEVEAAVGHGDTPLAGHIPFTPPSKTALALSAREALKLGHKYIGPEHLLLGLICEGEGVAAKVLAAHAVDLSRVRQKVLELLAA